MYTIKQYPEGYTVGTGYRRKLTWQGYAIIYWVVNLALVLGMVAVAAFITPKVIAWFWLIAVYSFLSYTILDRLNSRLFKLFPYKVDKWDDKLEFNLVPEYTTVDLLQKLLDCKEIEYFGVIPQELTDATVTTLKMHKDGKLSDEDLQEYNSDLEALLAEIEKMQNRELLVVKDNQATVLKVALEAARDINKELGK